MITNTKNKRLPRTSPSRITNLKLLVLISTRLSTKKVLSISQKNNPLQLTSNPSPQIIIRNAEVVTNTNSSRWSLLMGAMLTHRVATNKTTMITMLSMDVKPMVGKTSGMEPKRTLTTMTSSMLWQSLIYLPHSTAR
jgi:hypothetical protein